MKPVELKKEEIETDPSKVNKKLREAIIDKIEERFKDNKI